jgi:GNAT superfamily N-acetyltransferase
VPLTIRPAQPADESVWRELWRGYCDFYEAIVSEPVTAATWRRILEPGSAFEAFVAVEEDRVLGFANLVVHPFTWSESPACLLEDLFVAPEARGRGVGRALIRHLLDLAPGRGWARVYWHTREDNAAARGLYDTFRPADGFVRYVIPIGDQS